MSPVRIAALASGSLLIVSLSAAVAADCSARSGESRARLIELYTSEGCSSCPPADRWLSALRASNPDGAQLVPLALHVDYWNRLGWPDRFSDPAYSERQQWIARVNRSRTVYTPQFVLDGRDGGPDGLSRDQLGPGGAVSPDKASRENVIPAAADLRLALDTRSPGRLVVTGEARMRVRAPGAALYLALHEDNLLTQVAAGENAGKKLRHDYVVRKLIGPIPMPAEGSLPIRHVFELHRDWKRADLGVSAFVQDTRGGEVYQALRLAACG